jgi:acyl-CoA thioesterase-2
MVDELGADDFLDRITLQQIDRDIFTGICHSGAPMRAFGGQIAAQSLMAAGTTVSDPNRDVHSLHGYFLRPGRTQESIAYLVERPRDGGSFSTRIVRAVQNGETIFMMTASFAVTDAGPEHQFSEPLVIDPALVPEASVLGRIPLAAQDRMSLHYPEETLLELLIVGDEAKSLELIDGRYERMAWVRVTQPLPASGLVQACALTYLSDLTMVGTALAPHPQNREDLQLASIDHAMWFHAPVRADQWLLFAQDTPVARHGHGLARGLFYDTNGALVASVVQESLMRTNRGRG